MSTPRTRAAWPGGVIAALSAADVPDETISHITGLIGPLAEQIVSRAES
jgi:hypothetical protein